MTEPNSHSIIVGKGPWGTSHEFARRYQRRLYLLVTLVTSHAVYRFSAVLRTPARPLLEHIRTRRKTNSNH